MGGQKKDNKGRILKTGERQREDGRYEYRYTDSDGKIRSVYSWRLVSTDKVPNGKQKGEALRDVEKSIRKDLDDGVQSVISSNITLNDVFASYIKTKINLKHSTMTNYLYMYEKYVSQSIGKMKIASIKYSDVKKYYISLMNDYGFRTNSLDNINTIIHPTFTFAVRDGMIRNNPSDGVVAEIKKDSNNAARKRHALTIQQQEIFVNYCKNSVTYRHWLPIIIVMLGTGCRVGEVAGLRWCDCDFEDNTISINHSLLYRGEFHGRCEYHISSTKTEAGNRVIPMFSQVRAALLEQKMMQAASTGRCTDVIDGMTDFVFTNRYGNILGPNSINRALDRIIKSYNSEETEAVEKENREAVLLPHFTVHNLRHTFCTRLCENESNLKVIQETMGHSDITTTMNIYNEVTRDKMRESFVNLEGKVKIC